MLPSNEILHILGGLKSSLARYGVSSIGLFGSALRGDAGPDSDIDILLDFRSDQETFGNFMASCDLLEDKLKGEKIDIVTLNGLSPYIGRYILREVVYV